MLVYGEGELSLGSTTFRLFAETLPSSPIVAVEWTTAVHLAESWARPGSLERSYGRIVPVWGGEGGRGVDFTLEESYGGLRMSLCEYQNSAYTFSNLCPAFCCSTYQDI